MEMKKFIGLCAIVLSFVGCSKGDMMSSGPGSYTDVEYAADIELAEGGSPFFVKGEYTNERGELVAVDAQTPWVMKLTDVPYSVKASFKGYVYCSNTKRIVGLVSMVVTAAGSNKVIFTTKNEYNLYNDAGYTNEALKEATAFNFLQK